MQFQTGLYVITPDAELDIVGLRVQVAAAIAGGARIVQYRNKFKPRHYRRQAVAVLAQLCGAAGATLIVNDDVELTAETGAHGVHIGRGDTALQTARTRLGQRAIIGVSCYNQLDLALAAQSAGANYVAFGSFFASPTKPQAVQASPELLRRARPLLKLPIVAIGGITPENGGALISAGADMLAVISGVFGQPDITAAALAYRRLFPEELTT